jgi:peptide-methionine (S)-S-oxide reductase
MKSNSLSTFVLVLLFVPVLCIACTSSGTNTINTSQVTDPINGNETGSATFGAGCFWCVEAIFDGLKGVISVESGYSGGTVKNPAYREVCEGTTGHAEVCRITFDPEVISFDELLTVFWYTHDPTTINRQGNDWGTQYRSAIFYHDENQKMMAERSRETTNRSGLWDNPIITEISPLTNYYKAEDYHQDYFVRNRSQPYCSAIIAPKLEKFRKQFKDKLK